MPKTISITLPHDLGAAEAKRRVQEQMDRLCAEYVDKIGRSQVNWTGDTATFDVSALGQNASGSIAIFPDSLKVDVQLPWIMAALTNKVQGFLNSNASEALRIGTTKK
jgi:putative polyhydroxyalkanoate system protein